MLQHARKFVRVNIMCQWQIFIEFAHDYRVRIDVATCAEICASQCQLPMADFHWVCTCIMQMHNGVATCAETMCESISCANGGFHLICTRLSRTHWCCNIARRFCADVLSIWFANGGFYWIRACITQLHRCCHIVRRFCASQSHVAKCILLLNLHNLDARGNTLLLVEIHFCSWKYTFARGNTLLLVEIHFCSWKHTYIRGNTLLLVEIHLCSWQHTYIRGNTLCIHIRIVTQGCFLVLVQNRHGIFVLRWNYICI